MTEHRIKNMKKIIGVTPEVEVSLPPPSQQQEPDTEPNLPAEGHAELLKNLAKAVEEVKLATDSVTKELGNLSVALARMIVERLIGSSEELQAQRLIANIQEALSAPEPTVGVAVNSTDAETVKEYFGSIENPVNVDLKIDDSIAVGECRVKFDTHDLVSSIESQLDAVEANLREVFGNEL